jgi:hypothetical protein
MRGGGGCRGRFECRWLLLGVSWDLKTGLQLWFQLLLASSVFILSHEKGPSSIPVQPLSQSLHCTFWTDSTQEAEASGYHTSKGLGVAYKSFPPIIKWYACTFSFHFCSYETAAQPCDEDGIFLQPPWDSAPLLSALPNQDDSRSHNWAPFDDRIAFDWAHYHYVTLQLLAAKIAEGLDLWSATCLKYSSTIGAPWRNAKEMYATIDTIQVGSLPFKSFPFRYTGPKPSLPPHWMEQEYELNARNVLDVVREQLATPDFKDQFNYVPYKEFNGKGECIWSNMMSGQWAFMQAVCPFSHFIFFFKNL